MFEKNTPKVTEEKAAILARLAAGDFVSLLSLRETPAELRRLAIIRYACHFVPGAADRLSIGGVDAVGPQLLAHWETAFRDAEIFLQKSRVTINFKAFYWFMDPNTDTRFLNHFEKAIDNDGYRKVRNQREIAIYEAGRPTQGQRQTTAFERIETHGTLNNSSFQPAIRPRYGALDISRNHHGGAGLSTYGRSFLVLREHVKHRASYFYTDSFNIQPVSRLTEQVVSFYDLGMLLIYCSKARHKVIGEFATHQRAPGSPIPNNEYIEAQLHTEIVFNRDVAELHLAAADLTGLDNGLETKYADMVRQNAKHFCRANNIKLRHC